MKPKRLFLILLVLAATVLLSACAGGPLATGWPGISAGTDSVYVANGSFVTSVRVSDGGMAWRYPEKADAARMMYAAPAVSDNLLVVGNYKNELVALNPKSGAQVWVFTGATGRFVGGATISGDTVLAPNSDHFLYAVDLNGALRWKFETGNMNWATPVVNTADKVVYQSSMDHSLYALALADGSKLWATDLGGAALYSPALDADNAHLYVGTVANELLALNAGDGKIVWRFKTDGAVWSTPLLKDGKLYFGDASGKIYSITAADGALVWSASAGSPILGSPALTAAGLVFTTEGGSLQPVSLEGQLGSKKEIGGTLYGSPVVIGDRLVVAVHQGNKLLAAVDANGNDIWQFVMPK